ncbi:hypothetical protein [Halovulum sp. GXIMD14793]
MKRTTEHLTLVRGTVTATRERLGSVNMNRKTGYGSVNTTSELWIRDSSNTEHQFYGDMFDAAQPGHDVAVVIKRSSGKPVAFANFTADFVRDAKELRTSTSFGSILAGAIGVTFILSLPGLIIWGALAETFGLLDAAFTGTGFQIYLVLMVVCAVFGIKVWAKGYRERTDVLKAEVDRLLILEQEAKYEA